MRSSKSRSRSKSNRPRSMGNIVNRVFDSSGPEGKVRGTPQQIIEKYLFLARDAQLSNDRVAAENFLQHAEHYTRMLGEAQREMVLEQEQRRQSQDNGQQNRDRSRDDQPDYNERPERTRSDEVIDLSERDDHDTGLVETPEARPEPQAQAAPESSEAPSEKPARGPRRPRGPRKPRAAAGEDGASAPSGDDTPSASAAE